MGEVGVGVSQEGEGNPNPATLGEILNHCLYGGLLQPGHSRREYCV